MDGLANGADTMPCTNCGHEIRRGMLRCRECGQSIVDSAEEVDEFVLNGHELLPSQDPKCPLCGAFLEPDTADCAACTSALLDQLLNGPGPDEPGPDEPGPDEPGFNESASNETGPGSSVRDSNFASPRPSNGGAKLHVRRAAPEGGRDRAARGGAGGSAKPGATTARARQADPARSKAKGAGAQPRGKQVPQFASPSDIDAANQQAVNQHAANRQSANEVTADEEDSDAGTSTTVETSAACTALLASLATADAMLRCGIATALGKLGDKTALVPLERHLSDQDVRVRRAVAAALVQLGHPKGQTLLDIAERKPAAAVLMEQRASSPSFSPPKPRKSSGGGGMDSGTLKMIMSVLVAVAIIGGGAWYWMSSDTPSGGKKSKSAAAKKAAAKKAAAKKAAASAE